MYCLLSIAALFPLYIRLTNADFAFGAYSGEGIDQTVAYPAQAQWSTWQIYTNGVDRCKAPSFGDVGGTRPGSPKPMNFCGINLAPYCNNQNVMLSDGGDCGQAMVKSNGIAPNGTEYAKLIATDVGNAIVGTCYYIDDDNSKYHQTCATNGAYIAEDVVVCETNFCGASPQPLPTSNVKQLTQAASAAQPVDTFTTSAASNSAGSAAASGILGVLSAGAKASSTAS